MKTLDRAMDHIGCAKVLAAGLFAAQLCLLAAHPEWLMGEGMELVRKGVMVDESVCQSAGKDAQWDQIQSEHFRIFVERGTDLAAVEMRLRKRLFIPGENMPADVGMDIRSAARLDMIYERARQVLDMPPKRMKTSIMIFRTNGGLNKEYTRLTGNTGDIKAFHVQDCGIIFTSEDSISDSVMAHEIAHVIVDNYYNGIPPSKVSEMLASYVDMHIADR